ncbi:DUF6520 family protein [Chitinophaga sedimenti]|uniref:DUF6520 family protein n=1 Tax=Chitinophaga sedimenti TaxID=2033606 RepID=UPI0020067D90|nr:DUF6520 family protein [Chitinophaga sedimenti]MCK7557720.1 DUF6520 family protein [Chitinophaga sedimenti]
MKRIKFFFAAGALVVAAAAAFATTRVNNIDYVYYVPDQGYLPITSSAPQCTETGVTCKYQTIYNVYEDLGGGSYRQLKF